MSLFDSPRPYHSGGDRVVLVMTEDQLWHWKERIFNYQQDILRSPINEQTSLFFDLNPAHVPAHTINPFLLKISEHNEFYRRPPSPLAGGRCCLYFVIDHAVPLLLYVGETKRTAKERWTGGHDCKDYLSQYHSLHYQYDLTTEIKTSFWYDTPSHRPHRLKLERELILRWRSPFNKECWQFWGQPFPKLPG